MKKLFIYSNFNNIHSSNGVGLHNQPLNFDTSNVTSITKIFSNAKAFLDKYNSGEPLPNYTNEIKKWLNENREKMNMIDFKEKHGDEIDGFFSNILLTECNKQFACKKSCL